ncbi:hypothetical protein F2Q70_00016149 [Brassica cretica]|uniref:HVA22-like protein n=1 Tax=Brassica cretica TaxID=69181 RepID=A0A8S9KVW0_BRACR|nr:hypothetical protein F2Q70_00016149 [Brassica cretica]KAF2597811.1 hypothetical protein F2Q68_00009138 [Brassica cretica]
MQDLLLSDRSLSPLAFTVHNITVDIILYGDITMIGSFLTRPLMILVAALTILERVGDALVSWLPLYSEAKLAFFVYLWFPKTKGTKSGTTYVYNAFFKPYVSKHENDIDRNLVEIKTRAGDMAMIYLQKAFDYGHARFFEILQYIREQSTPKPQSKEKKETTTPQLDDLTLTVTEENKATHDEMKKG